MNKSGITHRKANGRRVEGRALVARVASELKGMMLAHAYVVVKRAGYQLKINKLDGVSRDPLMGDKEIVNVDVVSGFVRNSWATA